MTRITLINIKTEDFDVYYDCKLTERENDYRVDNDCDILYYDKNDWLLRKDDGIKNNLTFISKSAEYNSSFEDVHFYSYYHDLNKYEVTYGDDYETEVISDADCTEIYAFSNTESTGLAQESTTIDKVSDILDGMKELLIYKNTKYGDSAIKPKHYFYKGDAQDSIKIRLDDKLSRIVNNDSEIRTNDVCDVIGYLTLLLVSMNVSSKDIEKLKD